MATHMEMAMASLLLCIRGSFGRVRRRNLLRASNRADAQVLYRNDYQFLYIRLTASRADLFRMCHASEAKLSRSALITASGRRLASHVEVASEARVFLDEGEAQL